MAKSLPAWALPALFVAIFGGVFIAVKVGRRRDVQRYAELEGVCAKMGMSFTPHDVNILREFGGFAVKPAGDYPRVTAIMRGTVAGRSAILFDYDVSIGTANNKNILRRFVAAFDISATPLPVFAIEGGREDRFSRMMDKVFAEKGIQFAEDADFAVAFHVAGADEDGVRRALTPAVRSLMMKRPEWACRSTGKWLLFCFVKTRPTPTEVPGFVAEASELMQTMTTRT